MYMLVNTNGAAAKVINFDRLGKKVRPGIFGKITGGSREYPKSPSVKKHENRSDPISADPSCPLSEPGVVGCQDADQDVKVGLPLVMLLLVL